MVWFSVLSRSLRFVVFLRSVRSCGVTAIITRRVLVRPGGLRHLYLFELGGGLLFVFILSLVSVLLPFF